MESPLRRSLTLSKGRVKRCVLRRSLSPSKGPVANPGSVPSDVGHPRRRRRTKDETPTSKEVGVSCREQCHIVEPTPAAAPTPRAVMTTMPPSTAMTIAAMPQPRPRFLIAATMPWMKPQSPRMP